MTRSAECNPSAWQGAIGQPVVLDLSSSFVILGVLTEADEWYIRLIDADVHDLRDSKTTRELYVLEARRHGVRSNRKSVTVRMAEVVSFSLLVDVIE